MPLPWRYDARMTTHDRPLPAPTVDNRLGQPLAYEPVWHAMQQFTDNRTPNTPDTLWLLEHQRVYTQGTNGRPEHLLTPGDIPVVQSDRGGQVTYHGPGQLMVYIMVDLRRLGIGVRTLVTAIEQAIVATLADYSIRAHARRDAPGVYVGTAKIGSLGLRIRKGASFHGLALNVDMDLEPFSRINPCGYADLSMTQISNLGGPASTAAVASDLVPKLCGQLGLSLPDN